jgi:hypothetical protein
VSGKGRLSLSLPLAILYVNNPLEAIRSSKIAEKSREFEIP